VIHVVTLANVDPEAIDFLTKRLYAAYGVGAEYAGDFAPPQSEDAQEESGAFHASKLLQLAEGVETFADDKILYIVDQPLIVPEGPMGKGPVTGFADYGAQRAVATTQGLDAKGALPFPEGLAKRVAHEAGHLWELHHCFDVRCVMYPPWMPVFQEHPDVALCPFCREKSERRIRRGAD
jgi:predicted Zn-dependent protease